jgi:hypothetical protein
MEHRWDRVVCGLSCCRRGCCCYVVVAVVVAVVRAIAVIVVGVGVFMSVKSSGEGVNR